METVNYWYKELNLSNSGPRSASAVTIIELTIAITIALYWLVQSSSSLPSMNRIYSWFSGGKELLIAYIAQYGMAFLTTFPKQLLIYQMYCFVASVMV